MIFNESPNLISPRRPVVDSNANWPIEMTLPKSIDSILLQNWNELSPMSLTELPNEIFGPTLVLKKAHELEYVCLGKKLFRVF